jgi:hypothetical protein
MNERIKELAPQCWELTEFGLNFNYQKFAELIVRECADIGHLYEGGEYEVRNQIMAHFGVEE